MTANANSLGEDAQRESRGVRAQSPARPPFEGRGPGQCPGQLTVRCGQHHHGLPVPRD